VNTLLVLDNQFKSKDLVGYIPPLHVRDGQEENPEKYFKPGDVIRVRVSLQENAKTPKIL